MRWPFSRRGNGTAPPRGAPVEGPAPAVAGPAPVQRRAEWATLPPIQRAAGDIELTAESELFVDHLTGHSPVETALQPLGHDVSMEAPAGIATGIARPVQHHAGDAPLQHRLRPAPKPKPAARAQRAPVTPAAAPVQRAQAAAPPPAPEPVEVAREEEEPVEEQAATMPAEEAATSPGAPAAAPVQRASAPAPSAPATSPSPVARHETDVPHEDEVATVPAAEAAPPPEDVQRAAEDEEEATVPEGGDAAQRAPEPAPSAVPTVGARPVVAAQVFRSSLSPVAPNVGREPGAPLRFAAQRAPSEARAAAPGAGAVAAPSPAPTAGAPPARPSAPGDAPAGHVGDPGAIQRAAAGHPPVQAAPPPADPSRAPLPATPSTPGTQRAAGEPPRAPARPATQRAGEGAAPPAAASTVGSTPPLGRRSGLGAPLASPESVERGSFSPEGGPRQRTFRRTRSSLAAQRAASDSPVPSAPGVEAQAPSAPLAGAGPPLSRPAPGPASAQRSPAQAPDTPLPLASSPGVQRHAEAPAPEPEAETPFQRAPEIGPAAEPSGFDAFVAHASALAAGRTPAGEEPGGDDQVQRAPEQLDFPAEPGTLAPRLDLPHRRRGRSSGTAAPAPVPTAAEVQRAPVAPSHRPAVLPLVGKRPLQVQRSTEDVPPAIRAGVEEHVSRSLEGVKVHRHAESGSAARQLQARAFTTGGEIHLPAEHGPIDREPARSLVAHELVHVAQQRELGPNNLPGEDSPRGRELEAQARRVEVAAQSVAAPARASHSGSGSSPLVLARRAESPVAVATAAAVAAARRSATSPYTMTAAAPQLAPDDPAPAFVPAPPGGSSPGPFRIGSNLARPAEPQVARVETPPPPAEPRPAPAEPQPAPANVDVAPAQNGGGGGQNAQFDPLTGLVGHTDDSGELLHNTQLEQVWTFVRGRLTDELLADRERGGLSIDIF